MLADENVERTVVQSETVAAPKARAYKCSKCGKPKKGHVCGSTDTAVEAESTGPTCESTEQAEMPVEKPAEKPEKRLQKKRKRATSEGRRTRSKA